MKLILAGGTGYLGSIISTYFAKNLDNQIIILTRSPKENIDNIKFVKWDSKTIGNWTIELEQADVLINLTGKSVNCRYNSKNKKEILASRIDSTTILGKAIQKCEITPKLWINSSSATIYIDSKIQEMDEEAGIIGNDFSMNICKEWEKCFNQFELPNTRKIGIRTGIVLGNHPESALTILKNLVRFGLGGKMGNGEQFMSVIKELNFLRVIDFLIQNANCSGYYNVVNPIPITNNDFMKGLRNELKIPFGLNHPIFLLEIGSYFMSSETELVLKSRKVIPKRLLNAGFIFENL